MRFNKRRWCDYGSLALSHLPSQQYPLSRSLSLSLPVSYTHTHSINPCNYMYMYDLHTASQHIQRRTRDSEIKCVSMTGSVWLCKMMCSCMDSAPTWWFYCRFMENFIEYWYHRMLKCTYCLISFRPTVNFFCSRSLNLKSQVTFSFTLMFKCGSYLGKLSMFYVLICDVSFFSFFSFWVKECIGEFH